MLRKSTNFNKNTEPLLCGGYWFCEIKKMPTCIFLNLNMYYSMQEDVPLSSFGGGGLLLLFRDVSYKNFFKILYLKLMNLAKSIMDSLCINRSNVGHGIIRWICTWLIGHNQLHWFVE